MPIAGHSTIPDAGDIVWVPVPFVEAPRMRDRPALVVSTQNLGGPVDLLWVLMITSAANAGWPDDVAIGEDYESCGLSVPCVVRTAKISTVEAASAKPLGRLPEPLMHKVTTHLALTLGLTKAEP